MKLEKRGEYCKICGTVHSVPKPEKRGHRGQWVNMRGHGNKSYGLSVDKMLLHDLETIAKGEMPERYRYHPRCGGKLHEGNHYEPPGGMAMMFRGECKHCFAVFVGASNDKFCPQCGKLRKEYE